MTILSARLRCIAAERRIAAKSSTSVSAAKRIVAAKTEREPMSLARVIIAVLVGVPLVIGILAACGVV